MNDDNMFSLHVHFPNLIPNSDDNLNNLTFDLNVSTPQGQWTLLQITRAFSFSLHKFGWLQVSSVFFKGKSTGHLQKWNILHVS